MKDVGGKVDSPGYKGDKGIPAGIKTGGGSDTTKKVQTPTVGGDKGIPPMNANPTAPAPKD